MRFESAPPLVVGATLSKVDIGQISAVIAGCKQNCMTAAEEGGGNSDSTSF